MSEQKQKIAFQGERGANSHMACQAARPDLEPLSCQSFEDMLEAVTNGDALCAMVPVENSVAGRVADIHHLLPDSGLYIIGEHYQRINAMLLGVPGAKIAGREGDLFPCSRAGPVEIVDGRTRRPSGSAF